MKDLKRSPFDDAKAAAISVIVPTHGRPTELRRALDSIRNQTVSPSEIIVVDDLDEDDAKDVVREFGQRCNTPVRYVSAESNRGSASRSRNLGLYSATGTYVAFLDDDDAWQPEYLSTAVCSLQRNEADFVVTHTKMRFANTTRPYMQLAEELGWTDCLANNPGMTGSNFLAKRDDLIKLEGFDENLLVGEDQDLLLRLLRSQHTYSVVRDVLVTQYADGANHLSSAGPRQAVGLAAFIRKHSADLTLSDRRYLRTIYHGASAYSGRPLHVLAFHRIAQLLNYPPRLLLKRAVVRLRGQGRAYK